MAFEKSWHAKSYLAASAINAMQPVALLGALTAASSLNETIVPAGSINITAFGVARATVATPGMPVDVDLAGYVKVLAAASIGAGAFVAVGSTNGVVIQIGASAAAAPTLTRNIVGVSESAALTGDIFTIRLNPAQFF